MIPLYHEFKILGRIIKIFVFKYHQVILPYIILYQHVIFELQDPAVVHASDWSSM